MDNEKDIKEVEEKAANQQPSSAMNEEEDLTNDQQTGSTDEEPRDDTQNPVDSSEKGTSEEEGQAKTIEDDPSPTEEKNETVSNDVLETSGESIDEQPADETTIPESSTEPEDHAVSEEESPSSNETNENVATEPTYVSKEQEPEATLTDEKQQQEEATVTPPEETDQRTEQPAAASEEPQDANDTKPAEPTAEEQTESPKAHEVAATGIAQDQDNDSSKEQPADKELKSEADLNEKDDHHDDDDDHEEELDYTKLSKEELVDLIKTLAKDDRIVRSDNIAKEIKPHFDEIHDAERAEALKKFKDEGGEEADFDFKNDELANRFDANFKLIRDRKTDFVKNREQQKEANLKKKQEILEKLRDFVDSDDTNISFDDFKQIQNEWKSLGPVPGAYAKTLWANYNALIDRFYDNRSIYFELKELDRRKNLEAKFELCERAETLSKQENLKDAVAQLNDLHHEFKHIGPVPKEEQEPLWIRFKAASDAVYERRKGYVEELKGELEENFKVKAQLADEVEEFTKFDSDRIKEWNSKTKEIIAVQKKWEATGGLPRAKAKDVNKKFWGSFKTFFNNKGAFFKRLDAARGENLEKKKVLLERALELKDNTDWQKTADAFKRLQREWKEIGPVPEKHRGEVYKEFKAAADHFFANKRDNNKEVEKEFEVNLAAKNEICERIEKMAEEKSNDVDAFRDLRDEYMEIGFVPRKNISEIKSRYAEAVDKYINSLEDISNEDRQRIRLENQLNRIIQGPNADQKLYRKEQSLRKQIGKVESDIAVWKNNMEFFAESKTANKMKDEFQEKIDSASDQLKSLKQQLRIIRTAS